MKRIMLEVSAELGAAIDAAVGDRQRTPTLEAWLWRVREIREAAQRLGVRKPVRRGRGRGRPPKRAPCRPHNAMLTGRRPVDFPFSRTVSAAPVQHCVIGRFP